MLWPLDFVARLAALVPKPRVNLARFYGVFTTDNNPGARVTPAKRGKGGRRASTADPREPIPHSGIDIETCPACEQFGRAIQNWIGTNGVLETYAGDQLVRRCIEVEKLSTAISTQGGTARPQRFGHGVFDEDLNMQGPGREAGLLRVQRLLDAVGIRRSPSPLSVAGRAYRHQSVAVLSVAQLRCCRRRIDPRRADRRRAGRRARPGAGAGLLWPLGVRRPAR